MSGIMKKVAREIGFFFLYIAIMCVVWVTFIPFSCQCPEYLQSIPYWIWMSVVGILVLLGLFMKKTKYIVIALFVAAGISLGKAIIAYATCACMN